MNLLLHSPYLELRFVLYYQGWSKGTPTDTINGLNRLRLFPAGTNLWTTLESSKQVLVE